MDADVEIIWRFGQQRALVVGDVMLDSYLDGTADRLCREAPVPVVRTQAVRHVPGGAANVAVNVRALGARVVLVGLIGSDAAGLHLRAALRERGIDDGWLVEDAALSTLQKLRVRAAGQLLVRIDDGQTSPDSAIRQRILDNLAAGLGSCDVVILSDYGYGVLDDVVLDHLSDMLRFSPCPVVIDTKAPERFVHIPATVMTPSHLDVRRDRTTDLATIEREGHALLQRLRASYLAITLAHEGVLLLDRAGQVQHFPARAVTQASSIGAGDVFTATLALGLAAGAACEHAVQVAMRAAELAVCRADTVTIDRLTLLRALCQPVYQKPERAHWSLAAARAWAEAAREAGHTITLVAGSFESIDRLLWHTLSHAKGTRDLLIAAVWSDKALARRPERDRRIGPEHERAALAASFLPVDSVVVCEESSVAGLIRTIRPHYYVVPALWPRTADDYAEQVAAHDVGTAIVRLPATTDMYPVAVTEGDGA